MTDMTDEKFSEIACAAINAAQRVIYDSGIRDLAVHTLGFAKTDDMKAGKKDIVSEVTYDCPCWDCTGGGGPCICNGPAC